MSDSEDADRYVNTSWRIKEFVRLLNKYGCVELFNHDGYIAMAPIGGRGYQAERPKRNVAIRRP